MRRHERSSAPRVDDENLRDQTDTVADARRVSCERSVEGPQRGVEGRHEREVGGVVGVAALKAQRDRDDLGTIIERVKRHFRAPDPLPRGWHAARVQVSRHDRARECVGDLVPEQLGCVERVTCGTRLT